MPGEKLVNRVARRIATLKAVFRILLVLILVRDWFVENRVDVAILTPCESAFHVRLI
jgi:hypothetical protein